MNTKEAMINDFISRACVAAVNDEPYALSDVCELADTLLVTRHPEIERHVVEDPEGVFHYNSPSEELFNTYLTEVESALEGVGLVYNAHASTWVVPPKQTDTYIHIPFPDEDRDVFVHDPNARTSGPTERLHDALDTFTRQTFVKKTPDALEEMLAFRGFTVLTCKRVRLPEP